MRRAVIVCVVVFGCLLAGCGGGGDTTYGGGFQTREACLKGYPEVIGTDGTNPTELAKKCDVSPARARAAYSDAVAKGY